MRIPSLLLAAAALAAIAGPSDSHAARGTPALCPVGRFTVATPPIVTGGVATPGGTLTISEAADGIRVSLGTACRAEEQIAASLKRRKKGTQLVAAWSACAGLEGRVRLRGVIRADGCATFTGTIRGRGIRLRLDATRAAIVCGDGIIDPAEVCDPTSATPTCTSGQGCVRSNEQCGCAALCGGTQPSAETLDTAVRAALATDPGAFADVASFDRFRGAVQSTLGCALNTGSLQPTTPDPLPAPGGYNSATQYCGPGDSTADWRLGLVAPDACLNLACYEHDRCTATAGGGCDEALLAACERCAGTAAAGLFSWLTPDSFVLCSALRLLVGGEVPLPTTTTTLGAPTTTLPGAPGSTTSSTTITTSTLSPVPTTSSTTSSSTSSTAGPLPTVTTTSSSTSSTASVEGKDLIPENLGLAATEVPAGGVASLTWDVANRGTVTVTESYCDKIWLSANDLLDAGDAVIDSQCHFGSYASGAYDRRTLGVTIPAATPAGAAYLLVEADVQFTVAEGNEANNVAAVPLTITAAP